MAFSIRNLIDSIWERNKSGENWYMPKQDGAWGLTGSNLKIAQNHPILTPAMLFVSKLFSQAEFEMKNIKTGEVIKEHAVLTLLKNPNFYQTKTDLLESLQFMLIANGVAVLYKKSIVGMDDQVPAIYLLDYKKITWPEGFKTKLSVINEKNEAGNVKVVYDEGG